jgi:Putative GTPases (G3E family)
MQRLNILSNVQYCMYVYIIGGFLGSGKTTLLMKLASMYSKRGRRVAILVNEAGEIGVDGATLKAEGYDAIELPDGCICCSLSGTLQNAMKNIKKDIDPDIIIVEPTGLALPHKVRELIHFSMIDPDEMFIIGIADIQRFDDLIKKKEEFFKRQMYGADFILINKSDISTPEKMKAAMDWLKKEYPNKPMIPVSTKTGENLEKVYEMMQ